MMIEDTRYIAEREEMVKYQLQARDIHDPSVLEAFRAIPRHCFVPVEYQNLAYADGPLPIGLGQTISQPYIVAIMTQLLELKGDEKILEVGTGSGYQAAILAHLARQVITVERHTELARHAERILRDLGITNVGVHIGDGTAGWPDEAPYQGMLVTAAAPSVPAPLLKQLADGGRLVIPVGPHGSQSLELWQRQGQNYHQESIIPVAFVPLIGKHGWPES